MRPERSIKQPAKTQGLTRPTSKLVGLTARQKDTENHGRPTGNLRSDQTDIRRRGCSVSWQVPHVCSLSAVLVWSLGRVWCGVLTDAEAKQLHRCDMITMESGSTPWTTGGVIAAMTVGLSVAAAVWWLCSRCRVRIELKQVVDVEKEALFRFLSDPHNLKLIHPMTTEIRVEEEREEDGGLTVTRFVWVEKLPFTIETDVRLCSDPSTSTIVFDIRPRGILEVQLKWDCSGLAENRAGSVNLVSSYSPSDQDESPAPQRHHNFSDTSQDNGVAAEAAATATRKAATAAATTHQKDEDGVISWKRERSSTLFQNYISVTGPRAAAATVAAVLRSVHLKLMNRLQQHFMTKKE